MPTDQDELQLENTHITTAAGIDLTDDQKTLVSSVLDLFAGRPSLGKLQLWRDDATFEDPLTVAHGRGKFEAQWYGLAAAFSHIERLHHRVTGAGNPIEMELTTRYVVRGIGKEVVVDSRVRIFTDAGKIGKVEDRWDGELPENGIANAFRRLNASCVPLIVSVPKKAEEDARRGDQ